MAAYAFREARHPHNRTDRERAAPVLGRFARVHRARDKVEHLLPLDAVSIVCFKPDISRYMARVTPVFTSSRTDTDH